MKKESKQIRSTILYGSSCFLLPILIIAVVYGLHGIYPGSTTHTLLASDAYSQYSNFYANFGQVLKGNGSIFYSWNGSLGLNYWAFLSYYLGGIFPPLVVFFNQQQIPEFLYCLTLLKIGCLGLSFGIFSLHTFKLPKWAQLILATSYALMSYVVAFSEILMWFDGLIYLPLIILGINRLLEKKKPMLLFISYFLLFISNYYIAFMVGLFSFFYAIVRVMMNKKSYLKQLPMYLITSLLAGGASMVMILPMVLDLRNNGESLSEVSSFFTAATGPFDLVIKNMIGVYDSTKYGSIPFIYVGLLPLIFCLFYFVTIKVSLKDKLSYGSLFLLLIISFYIEPFNLLWQGFHSPNMFLFRFSFLFSFLVVMLAGYGLEKFERSDFDCLTTIVLSIMGLVTVIYVLTRKEAYDYLTGVSFILTLLFLLAYLFFFYFYQKRMIPSKGMVGLILILISLECGLNTYGIVEGISEEWHYPSREVYDASAEDIETLVQQTKEANDFFYRLENNDRKSLNDSFRFDYNGLAMFSSVRNRHSSIYLDALGYRSTGTNLNISYNNNTLLMEPIIGMKYNLSKQPVNKFGYKEVGRSGEFYLYENAYTMPLGILTDDFIYEEDAVQTQATLLNHLAGTNENFFSFKEMKQLSQKNIKESQEKINTTTVVTYEPEKWQEPMEIEWEAEIPAGKQAYISIYPTDYILLGKTQLTLEVNGQKIKSGMNATGQYYSLGYFDKPTTLTFKTIFSGLGEKNSVEMVAPDLALLDTDKYTKSYKKLAKKGVELVTDGRKVSGKVDLQEDQVLLTSIPYDRGWTAYVDGKKVTMPIFKEAFLTLPLTKGKHEVKFVFLPEGFKMGIMLSLGCLGLFAFYTLHLRKKESED
ncbi:YfhO family protein [Enterococcus sp. LJL99]